MVQYHPLIHFIYFCIVIGCSMFLMHPVCLGISLISAVWYSLYLFGWEKMRRGIVAMLFLMLLTVVINPAFSHQGVTVLTYLPTGNILTLESILYGMAAATMLAATLLWFRLMGEILTTDKMVYLFGKSFPIMGLILSMILGFLPNMHRKLSDIQMYRKKKLEREESEIIIKYCGGRFYRLKRFIALKKVRLQHGIQNLSGLISWALEEAVEKADSMKGRGYGLEGRTAYTIYRFTKRDGRRLVMLLLEGGYLLLGAVTGGIAWEYYPETGGAGFGVYPISIYLVYFLMCITPVLEDYAEENKWNRLRSAI